jgi:hypothetical protein
MLKYLNMIIKLHTFCEWFSKKKTRNKYHNSCVVMGVG